MRLRLDISYDGAGFHGWAAQPGLRTVQGTLEHWIAAVARLDDPVELVCAGRTDAGVHARGQVAHADVPDGIDPAVLVRRLRRALPADLTVRRVSVAPDGFDARFSAIWRRYAYRLTTGIPEPVLRGLVVRVTGELDVAAMNACRPLLLGLRDFAPFCKRRDGATTVRTLLDLDVSEGVGDFAGTLVVNLRADAFCHSMVRALVGALVTVGGGRRDLAWLEDVMATPTRAVGSPVLPPHGLVLEEVGYPPDDRLADRAAEARARRDGS